VVDALGPKVRCCEYGCMCVACALTDTCPGVCASQCALQTRSLRLHLQSHNKKVCVFVPLQNHCNVCQLALCGLVELLY